MMTDQPLHVAMIGQRGVPATFGGIEHHVEEVGSRLAARGHRVTVYCRSNYSPALEQYRGMEVRRLPTVGTRQLDAIVHSGLSTLVAVGGRPDIVHYHALGPGLLCPVPRYCSSAKVVLTVHALDQHRAKWGRGARAVLGAAGWVSARVPDTTIVVSEGLADHYERAYGRRPTLIRNGVSARQRVPPDEIAARYGLAEGSYLLFVGRLVPEKAPDLLIRAFGRLPGDLRLVVAGGSSFTDDYCEQLGKLAANDERVVLTGYVYGRLLDELYTNAAALVQPSTLEGFPLTVLEAASYGIPIVASDITPHREILGEDAPGRRLFRTGDDVDLAAALRRVTGRLPHERAAAASLRDGVLRQYRWEDVTDATEQAYYDLLRRGRGAA